MDLISAGLIKNLTDLITDSSIATVILLGLGLMLIIVEFFQPARGIPSYCGIVLSLCGIVIRMLKSDGTFIMLFYMLFGCALILLVAHVFLSLRQKKAWLTQSLAIKLEKAMNDDGIDDYEDLIDKIGTATTDIDENGHVTLGDINLYVASDTFIEKGSKVRVVRVSDDKIEVEAVEPSNETEE